MAQQHTRTQDASTWIQQHAHVVPLCDGKSHLRTFKEVMETIALRTFHPKHRDSSPYVAAPRQCVRFICTPDVTLGQSLPIYCAEQVEARGQRVEQSGHTWCVQDTTPVIYRTCTYAEGMSLHLRMLRLTASPLHHEPHLLLGLNSVLGWAKIELGRWEGVGGGSLTVGD